MNNKDQSQQQRSLIRAVTTILILFMVGGIVSSTFHDCSATRQLAIEAEADAKALREKKALALLQTQRAEEERKAKEADAQTQFLKTQEADLKERERREISATRSIYDKTPVGQPMVLLVDADLNGRLGKTLKLKGDDHLLLTREPPGPSGISDFKLSWRDGSLRLQQAVEFEEKGFPTIRLKSLEGEGDATGWSGVVIDLTNRAFSGVYSRRVADVGISIDRLSSEKLLEITSVDSNSDAAKAGIAARDVLQGFNGHEISYLDLEKLRMDFVGEEGSEAWILVCKSHAESTILTRKPVPNADFGRIGVTFVKNVPGFLVVESVEPNSPAALAGMQPLDQVSAVNGDPVESLTYLEALDRIAGPPGRQVQLSVFKTNQAKVSRKSSGVESGRVDTTFDSLTPSNEPPKAWSQTPEPPSRFVIKFARKEPIASAPAAISPPLKITPQRKDDVREVIQDYFAAGNSGSERSRAEFFSSSVYYYGAEIDLSAVQQRILEEERKFPDRRFDVVEMSSNVFMPSQATVHAVVQFTLGSSDRVPPVETGGFYFGLTRVRGFWEIDSISDKPFPGWPVADYRTHITFEDLRQSGADGKWFDQLSWQNDEELLREVLLQDRFNHIKEITRDPLDGETDYFSVGIVKRRDEWVKEKFQTYWNGELKAITSGNGVVQVVITNNRKIFVNPLKDSTFSAPPKAAPRSQETGRPGSVE